MAYVHRARKLCYLANPRTASRATAAALQEIGFEQVGRHHDGLRHVDGWEQDRNLYVSFTVVRDIYSTLESWAGKFAMSNLLWALEEVMENRHLVPDWPAWTLFPHAQGADFILGYEDLEKELNYLLLEWNLPPVELERIP